MPLPYFRKSLQWQGYDLKKATQLLDDVSRWSVERLLQQRQEILEHHFKFNAFYNTHVPDKTIGWNDLPILTKSDLQQPLHQRLSKGYTVRNVHKGKTSGSSGHPFSYAKDKFCHAMTWATFDQAYQQQSIDLDHSLEARFYGIPSKGLGRVKEQFKDFVGNRHRFPIFDMSNVVLEGYLENFRKNKYDYINGYTSSIVLFAKYCQAHNIILKEVCPTLKACIVTSEMLFDDDRNLLEKVVGVNVINEYGSSETGLIALQNQEGQFVVNTSTLFVEVVNDANQPLENGSIGRILITDLFNKAHPFIRYEIGDLGSISVENGKQVLQQLQGRTSDIARLPNGKVIPGLTFYYVTKSVINDQSTVTEFVIVQKEPLLFQIQYVAKAELTQKEQRQIQNAMADYADASIVVAFEKLDQLDRSKRGKLKQFVTEVDEV
ncbi:phenylacetate--CoA ligase family protein [Nonlabens marinus]|uniref:Capsular polysaccharide biosynthesis protein n=1 Tax=Nonlabens marinus S1-08 TaxID=1454201 RepID=W8VZN1_9FLAO|nr:phenylacetate--CoA ligase family protein [Nonlabens marinus]BAO54866.1 capsular polysaccharide biosynthesis protein [Nonlabens marinus S1-08]